MFLKTPTCPAPVWHLTTSKVRPACRGPAIPTPTCWPWPVSTVRTTVLATLVRWWRAERLPQQSTLWRWPVSMGIVQLLRWSVWVCIAFLSTGLFVVNFQFTIIRDDSSKDCYTVIYSHVYIHVQFTIMHTNTWSSKDRYAIIYSYVYIMFSSQ